MSPGWQGVVAAVERTATAQGRASSGLFSLEGTRLLERAVRAGVAVQHVLTCAGEDAARTRKILEDLRRAGARVHVVPEEVMSRLTEDRALGGVVALAPLPPDRELGDLVSGETPVLLAGVEIQDPGNTGALVRTALAAGASAYLAIGQGDPYHPRAVRTSMGSLFKLPAQSMGPPEQAVTRLRELGVRIVGAVSSGGIDPRRLPASRAPVAVLVGGEAFGLSAKTRESLDVAVTIPMAEGVDSYSVNAAAAVLLYEFQVRSRSDPR